MTEEEFEVAQSVGLRIPDYVRGLLNSPALVAGENPKRYWLMFKALFDERRSGAMSDWIATNDLATSMWEERVLRDSARAVIRAGKYKAVRTMLGVIGIDSSAYNSDAVKVPPATVYFVGTPKQKNEVESLLKSFGIGDQELDAISAQISARTQIMFEQMISTRQRRRLKLSKMQRSQESRIKPTGARE